MRTAFIETKSISYDALQENGLDKSIEMQVLELFSDVSVILTRQEIAEILGIEVTCSCGRVNKLINDGKLVSRGQKINAKTKKPRELVGLEVPRVMRGAFVQTDIWGLI